MLSHFSYPYKFPNISVGCFKNPNSKWITNPPHMSFVVWNSNPGLRIVVDWVLRNVKVKPKVYVIQTSTMGENILQWNAPSPVSLTYPETPQMNEGDSALPEKCTGRSAFPWSVRLVTDLNIWCKTKWTFEAIIWTILVKRKLVIGKKWVGGEP